MKKLIAKTIVFSLLILCVAISLFYVILATASPSTLSDFYFNVGNENLTIKYSEKSYEKSGDIEDLSVIVERSASFKRHSLVKKYGFVLINDGDYGEFAKSKGSGYKYYVAGNIVESLYALGEIEIAVDTAFSQTANYSEVNPIRVLISLAYQDGNHLTLKIILDKLELRENQNELCKNDVSFLRDYLK